MGGDPEQEYFVDGVTESLTTDLSRISGGFVIARNTAFTYKGKHVDVKQVGHELGVRYVLEGSVQRGGNRLRVNVQLIDSETGNHLWAERFDKPLADLFDMQDEIVARLANQLGTELVAAEARRAEQAPNPNSMDLYFQGMLHVNSGATPEYMERARGFFERALALDPGNVEALVGLANVDARSATYIMTDERAERLAAAEATLTKVLSLAPNHAMAHYLVGLIQIYSKRAAQGIAECERALALDRNLALAHALVGFAKYVSGRGEETEAHVLEALRLSPRDSNANVWMVWIGNGKAQIGADEEAVSWLRRGIEANRNLPVGHFFLAAALAAVNRHDEARNTARMLQPVSQLNRNTILVSAVCLFDCPVFPPTSAMSRKQCYRGQRSSTPDPRGGPDGRTLRRNDSVRSIQGSLSSILENIKTSRKPVVSVNQTVLADNQVVHLNCATLVAWNAGREIGNLFRLLRILDGIDPTILRQIAR
jgi:TolB-like protein